MPREPEKRSVYSLLERATVRPSKLVKLGELPEHEARVVAEQLVKAEEELALAQLDYLQTQEMLINIRVGQNFGLEHGENVFEDEPTVVAAAKLLGVDLESLQLGAKSLDEPDDLEQMALAMVM